MENAVAITVLDVLKKDAERNINSLNFIEAYGVKSY